MEELTKREISRCRICGHDLTKQSWHSEWELNQHYKTTTCPSCGKKTWIKVNFISSGDDNWKPLEEEEEK